MKRIAGLLAVDIDGTLITDHGHITDMVYTALEKAVSLQWEVVIASGRTFYAAKPIGDMLPFVRYGVLSNGACIMDMQKSSIVHLETLDPTLTEDVIRIVREHGAIPALYDSDIVNQSIYYDTLEGACKYFIRYINEDPRSIRVTNVMDYTENILQIGMIGAKDVLFSVKDALTSLDITVIALPFESTRFGGKSSDYWFLQVIAKMAQKKTALGRMAELLKIPEGRLIAVGDNYNDCDMIKSADIGVAMGNAPDEVKQIANVVVASNNHSGLAQVVDEVILSGKYFS